MNRTVAALLIGSLFTVSAWAAAPVAVPHLPQDAPTVEKGFKQLEAGDAGAAEATFQAVLVADPRSVGAYEGLVWTYMKMGQVDQAALMADKRLALTPNDEAWQKKRLAILSQSPARRDSGIAGYRDWSKAHPHDLTAMLRLAELLSWTPGKLPEAVAEYRAALALANDDREARLGLARTLAWNGQSREAAPIYDALLSENPNDADALVGRAQIARWNGDRATALRLLKRGSDAHPDDGRFFAEAARVALDGGQRGVALSDARQAVRSSPNLPDAKEALSLAEHATATRIGVRVSGSDESTGFRRNSVGLPLELYPFADTRLRIEPAYEKDEDDFDQLNRPNVGLAVLQGLSSSAYLSGQYRAYFPQDAGTTHEVGGELGFRPWSGRLELRGGVRRRALVDAPVGYEDVAFLSGVGSGGTTVAGIRERLQTTERYVGFTAAPRPGIYLYGNGTQGDLSDDNSNRSVAAGLGVDVFALLGVLPRHSLTIKYDYFYLDFDQLSTRYFSPGNFQVHTPGVDWRYHATDSLTAGLEAGVPMRVGGSTGYVAGGFFSWSASPRLSIEGRVRVVDDTQYHVTSFTLGPRIIF
jgi:tetratricopeptide (TPR) repeat protein